MSVAYISLHGTVCDPGFHSFSNRRTEWRILKKEKKKKTINTVNFLFEKWELFVCMCTLDCVLLNVNMFVYVLLLTRTYIRMFAYVLACILTYLPIYSAVCWWDRVRQRKRVWVDKSEWVSEWRKMEMDCCNQNFFLLLTLWKLKVYFDLNMKCLFCGEFCWVNDDD